MELLEQIVQCEHRYTELTSVKDDKISHINYIDHITPDLPMQNYTYITRNASIAKIKEIVAQEKSRLLNEKIEYTRLVFDPILPFSTELPELSDFTFETYNVFILDLKNIETIYADKNCYPIEHKDKKSLIELYKHINNQDTEYDPHIKRWLDIKFQEPEVDTVVYKHNGIFLGSCELFFNKNIVKLEDLEVLQEYRNRGIGYSLLKSAISIAKSKNVDILYLIAEREDWITDYYLKRGFKCFTEYNSCTLYS